MKTFKEYCMEKENIDESLKELGEKAKTKAKEILGLLLPINYKLLDEKQKRILSMINPDSSIRVPKLADEFGPTLAVVAHGEHAEYKNVADYLNALYAKGKAGYLAFKPIYDILKQEGIAD